jgi:hypothetical protein
MWGAVFDVYRGVGGRQWFGVVEMAVAVMFAVVSAVQPATSAGCYALSVVQLLVQVAMLTAVVVWRPYATLSSVLLAAFMYCGNVVLCVMLVVMITTSLSAEDDKEHSTSMLSQTLSGFALVNVFVFVAHRGASVYVVLMKLKLRAGTLSKRWSVGNVVALIIGRRTNTVDVPHRVDVRVLEDVFMRRCDEESDHRVNKGRRDRRLEALEVLVQWAIDAKR